MINLLVYLCLEYVYYPKYPRILYLLAFDYPSNFSYLFKPMLVMNDVTSLRHVEQFNALLANLL